MIAAARNFSVEDRMREKQEARDRDERLLACGQLSAQQLASRNGFFSSLDPSNARIARRRAKVSLM